MSSTPTKYVPRDLKYPCPTYVLTHNSDTEEEFGKHDTSPSWVVAFVRYAEPAGSYGVKSDITKIKAGDPMIVENDCISLSISNPKASFAKTASVTMKAGEVYYTNAVRPGDWVMIWVHDDQEHIDKVIRGIKGLPGGVPPYDFDSGLKHVGRVTSVQEPDVMSNNGVRTITQTVTCQAFLELASTIYFTGMAQYLFNPGAANVGNPDPQAAALAKANTDAGFVKVYQDRYKGLLTNYMSALGTAAEKEGRGLSPDQMIALVSVFVLGIDKEIANPVKDSDRIRASFNDSIMIPKPIARLLGRDSASRLWQFYNFYLGVQKYSIPSGKSQPWRDFVPQTKNADSDQPVKNDSVFRYSPERTDGSIYWTAPMWSNRTAWDILNDYLNPVVNEMYTCLRINPSSSGKGKIQPTIMVREQPFSTGLFNWIKDPDREKLIQQATQGKKQDVKTKDKDPKSNKTRTFYCNLPRWIIDESIIKSLNVSTNEGQRVNFVQVWGTSVNAMTAGMPSNEINSAEVYRANQMNVGNWYVDSADVSRHGLRSDIAESPYDFVRDGVFGTRTPIWARMRADWMFNGHLKYYGSVRIAGVWEPVCEGDNCQIRGIVYHIEAVNHVANLAPNGTKSFETILMLSRGILARSLTSPASLPKYAYSEGSLSDVRDNMPGITDVQATFSHNNRTVDGEKTNRRDD